MLRFTTILQMQCECTGSLLMYIYLKQKQGIISHHWQRLHSTFCAQQSLESLFDLPTQHVHAAPNIGC